MFSDRVPRQLTANRLARALQARRAIARDYERQGLSVPPERIVLTVSTSEAYSLLFKLLADGGDEVLVPRPSYPLFDQLIDLDLVAGRPYDLVYHGAWSIDFDSFERAFSPRTRVVILVSPNNPTGSIVRDADAADLAQTCASNGFGSGLAASPRARGFRR